MHIPTINMRFGDALLRKSVLCVWVNSNHSETVQQIHLKFGEIIDATTAGKFLYMALQKFKVTREIGTIHYMSKVWDIKRAAQAKLLYFTNFLWNWTFSLFLVFRDLMPIKLKQISQVLVMKRYVRTWEPLKWAFSDKRLYKNHILHLILHHNHVKYKKGG